MRRNAAVGRLLTSCLLTRSSPSFAGYQIFGKRKTAIGIACHGFTASLAFWFLRCRASTPKQRRSPDILHSLPLRTLGRRPRNQRVRDSRDQLTPTCYTSACQSRDDSSLQVRPLMLGGRARKSNATLLLSCHLACSGLSFMGYRGELTSDMTTNGMSHKLAQLG
jgi:hypothetical protein